jgi:hypothetical protein
MLALCVLNSRVSLEGRGIGPQRVIVVLQFRVGLAHSDGGDPAGLSDGVEMMASNPERDRDSV